MPYWGKGEGAGREDGPVGDHHALNPEGAWGCSCFPQCMCPEEARLDLAPRGSPGCVCGGGGVPLACDSVLQAAVGQEWWGGLSCSEASA